MTATLTKLPSAEPFKIERDIQQLPIGSAGRIIKYPFGKMEVGDSFSYPADAATRIRSAATAWGKFNGKTFSVRKQPDGSYRIWRTA